MRNKTRLLLICGAIGSPLFILVFLIEGFTRDGYNSLKHPISSLAIGSYGWIQVANFFVTGACIIAFAIGLWHKLKPAAGWMWEALLIGLAGMGLIGSGFFTTDAVYGYPADQPLLLSQFTLHGKLHIFFSLFVFIGLPAACFFFSKRCKRTGQHGWASYSLFTGIGIIVAFAISGIGFEQFQWLVDYAGLFQRLSIVIGWAWITILALYLLKPGDTLISK